MLLLLIVSVFGVFKTHSGKAIGINIIRFIKNTKTAKTKFDSVVWKDTSKIYYKPYVRRHMAGDLLSSGILNGISKRDVRQLLGKPESDLGDRYHYFLRPDGWGDAEVLAIDFNTYGRVNRAKITNN